MGNSAGQCKGYSISTRNSHAFFRNPHVFVKIQVQIRTQRPQITLKHICLFLSFFKLKICCIVLYVLTLQWYHGVNMTPTSFAVLPCRQYCPNPIFIILYFFYSLLINIPTAANLFPLLFFSKNFALYRLGSY